MSSQRIVVRAFNADGYHKDIAIVSERQVHMHDGRLSGEAVESCRTGLIGHGVSINPKDFPEMVLFEVVVELRS
jgi:hypothetical protein